MSVSQSKAPLDVTLSATGSPAVGTVETAREQVKEARRRLGQSLLDEANQFLAKATKLQQEIECPESVLVMTPVGARFVEVSRDVNLCDFTQAVAITRSSKHSG